MATSMTTWTSCAPGTFWDSEVDEKLVCVDVQRETADISTFTFRSVDERYFSFAPGQYLRFELDIDGETVSRCYSLSSSSLNPRALSVSVKRVSGGRISNWLHDHLKAGDIVRAAGPSGTFTLPPSAASGRFVFAAGGSGVTPLMSMVRSLADAHLYPDIVFLYAARTPSDLAFRDELLWRAKTTPNFRLVCLPESAQGEPGYSGLTGRVSEALLQVAIPDLKDRTVMCCGPAPYMAAIRDLSAKLGVPADRYFEESFTAADSASTNVAQAPEATAAADQATFKVSFTKQNKVVEVGREQTVLSVARKSGVSIPSSCGNGLCGTCKSKLLEGRVDMSHTGGIRQREIDAGFFLPCCAKPLTDLLIDR